jgi:hypothetical protein
MRIVTLLVALLICMVGLVGIVSPEGLMTVGQYAVTPGGLYAIAILRVGIGLLLMLVARDSRAPKTLRALGAVVLVAGLTTPFFGIERVRAILDWEARHRAVMRSAAVVLLAAGGLIAFAVSGAHRPHPGKRVT